MPKMESGNIDTVDVSWLHHSHRDHLSRTKVTASPGSDKTTGPAETHSDLKQPRETSEEFPAVEATSPTPTPLVNGSSPNSHVDNETLVSKGRRTGNDRSTEQKPATPQPVPAKGSAPKTLPGRRNSWISSISSKFSSGSTPPSASNVKENPNSLHRQIPPGAQGDHNPFGAALSPKDKEERLNDPSNAFTSSSPKNPSFLSNAFRKLSSGPGALGKTPANGSVCQRRVMNIDPNRDRCKVPELNQAKLKRVAFCVDVEIAGVSLRDDDDTVPNGSHETGHPPRTQASKTRAIDKGEGVALKNGEAAVAAKEKETPDPAEDTAKASVEDPSAQDTARSESITKEPTRKQEKKKRSEEERKERKERKRRLAEANGTVPLQLKAGEEDEQSRSSTPGSSRSRTQNHPTTDPVRIYRRCCQLRETPVLKKLVERMTSTASSTLAESPGTVGVLNLTDSPMTLQDIVTFSDWLAIVPVRKLILENCALTDEGIRSILAGLLSTKTMQQARSSRRSTKKSQAQVAVKKPFGVVEKLCLKGNTKIGPEGWRHICLFVHLSKSLKAIDLSGVPFPKTAVATSGPAARPQKPTTDIASTLACALTTRYGGDHLEELLLSECNPSTEDVRKICGAASACGLRRLGLANNGMTREGLEHVVRYLQAGKCEGLDLGGNDLNDQLDVLIPAMDNASPLVALSLADCTLTPAAIFPLLQAFPSLPNFRFVDLSHNPALFSKQPDALSMLRRFLPKMPLLKRIHLSDVNLSPDHTIALAEILPECPSLYHLNILENSKIVSLTSATDPAGQEEACAVYASLMTAVRISRTLIAVDIEVPSAESNEVVKALASQIVVYSLRNLNAIEDIGDSDSSNRPQVPYPEVLQHLVGHVDGQPAVPTEDDPAPDEDYVIGGTGVVKALGVCLGNVDQHHPELGDASRPSSSGRSTPVHRARASLNSTKKPRDMSKNLLGSARNILARIQTALIREDIAGNDTNYRRLQFLDSTLRKMIQRFEDEYPECRIVPEPEVAGDSSSQHSSEGHQDPSTLAASPPADTILDGETAIDNEDTDRYAIRLSRSGSNTSLHSRALTSEEGRIHRIGQNLRRDFLEPSLGQSDDARRMSDDGSHLNALRKRLVNLRDDDIRSRVDSVGPDKAFQELGSTVEELWIIQQQDEEAFQKFKESQLAAQINSGLRPPSSKGNDSHTNPSAKTSS